MVEFSDFECPHCRQLHEYLKTLEQKYPQAHIVFKNYPIEAIHPWAMTAAIAGHCAYETSSDAFWKMESAIFDQQDLISAENAYDKLTDVAIAAGLQRDAFRACLADPAAKEAVEADLALGQKLGVNSTPTVFINGREAVGGDPSAVEQLIEYELHSKR
jgi:protein-disulfide isomerase